MLSWSLVGTEARQLQSEMSGLRLIGTGIARQGRSRIDFEIQGIEREYRIHKTRKLVEMASAAPDLTVRGESIERSYGTFVDGRYVVNRRYQRKLIWTLEEKQAFIDSVIHGYPVPLILLAESAIREANDLEIIDGMQRLDAIVSFIQNKYAVDGKYFDLETMATAKAQMDSGDLVQRAPKWDRATCVTIASYLLPLSIYEFADDDSVDTIFRRINSGGRQLSRQELRSAGATGHLANVVRKLAAKVRGDDSYSDVLRLNEMQRISITNRDLDYGISVDDIFWVENGILSRDNVRKSQDEEIIADLIAFMLSDDPVPSRTEFLDDYYQGDDGASRQRRDEIENLVQRRSPELVVQDFLRVLDQIKLTISASGEKFDTLFFSERPANPVPRYFQAVFLALHKLIVQDNKTIADRTRFVESVRNSADHINVQGGGGRWGADARHSAVQAAVGLYQDAFVDNTETDPTKVLWITQLQNLLAQSYTEQAAYDFKQGFFQLGAEPSFDEESFEQIMRTLVAISNIARDQVGYVIVGVAENEATANRVLQLFAKEARKFETFWVSGVDHEIDALEKNTDQFFQMIVDRIRASTISEPLKSYIASHIKAVRYYDKTVFVFQAKGMPEPSLYDDAYFVRAGNQVEKLETAQIGNLFKRYG